MIDAAFFGGAASPPMETDAAFAPGAGPPIVIDAAFFGGAASPPMLSETARFGGSPAGGGGRS